MTMHDSKPIPPLTTALRPDARYLFVLRYSRAANEEDVANLHAQGERVTDALAAIGVSSAFLVLPEIASAEVYEVHRAPDPYRSFAPTDHAPTEKPLLLAIPSIDPVEAAIDAGAVQRSDLRIEPMTAPMHRDRGWVVSAATPAGQAWIDAYAARPQS